MCNTCVYNHFKGNFAPQFPLISDLERNKRSLFFFSFFSLPWRFFLHRHYFEWQLMIYLLLTWSPQSRVGLEFYLCGSSGRYSLKWENNRIVKTECCCHCCCYFHAVRNNNQLLKIHKRTESNCEVHLGDLLIEAVWGQCLTVTCLWLLFVLTPES